MAGGQADPRSEIFVGIRDGKIAEISPWASGEDARARNAEKRAACADFIDGHSHAIMPGLVNGHTHLAMTLFRGLSDDVPFHQWLFDNILPLEAERVDAEFVRVGTELAALESIRFGVTTVNDMYFFAETIADVLDRAGMRGWVAQGWLSGTLPEDKVLGRDKEKLFRRLWDRYGKHERIVPALAPHAPYTCDDKVFEQVRRISEEFSAPIHTHLSETAREVEDSVRMHGMTPVQRLAKLGVLTPRTLCAHCVHLDEADAETLRACGSGVSYNPDSNLKLSSGIAPIARYLKKGIPVAFGTDGAASNNDLSVFGAMDVGTKLQKLASGENTAMVATDALSCATWDGARAMGLQHEIGSLEVGKSADLIVIGLDHPHLQPLHDLRSQLVYSMQGLEVETVVCAGKVLMRNREFQTLDAQRIYSEAEAIRAQISRSYPISRDR